MHSIYSKYSDVHTIKYTCILDISIATSSESNEQVTIKSIDKNKLCQDKWMLRTMAAEMEAMKRIGRHRHVVKFVEGKVEGEKIVQVWERPDEGSLKRLIRKKGCLKEPVVFSLLLQLIEALDAVNRAGVVHRNVHPDSVCTKNNLFKLAGFDRCLVKNCRQTRNKPVGNLLILPPELMKSKEYTPKSDIWALGATLFEALYGIPPIVVKNYREYGDKVSSFQIHTNSSHTKTPSEYLVNLLRRMMTVNPDSRVSIQDLVAERPKIQMMLDTYDVAGIKIKTQAIEYFWSPLFALVESPKARLKMAEVEDLVEKIYQINYPLKKLPTYPLKKARMEYQFLIFVAQFNIKALSVYKLRGSPDITGCLLENAKKKLYESEYFFLQCCSSLSQAAAKTCSENMAKEKLQIEKLTSNLASISHLDLCSTLHSQLDFVVEEVISQAEDDIILKAAALHANILLDACNLSETISLYFQLDLPFNMQNYLRLLEQLDFETLVELMNAKIEFENTT